MQARGHRFESDILHGKGGERGGREKKKQKKEIDISPSSGGPVSKETGLVRVRFMLPLYSSAIRGVFHSLEDILKAGEKRTKSSLTRLGRSKKSLPEPVKVKADEVER